MVDFSFSEAYILSIFGRSHNSLNLKKKLQLLLGLYVCDFLDNIEDLNAEFPFQALVNEYLSLFNQQEIGKNFLTLPLERLRSSFFLKTKQEKLFNDFSLIHLTLKGLSYTKPSSSRDLNAFILQSFKENKFIINTRKLKKIIEFFNKNLFSVFRSYKHKYSMYELRLFWPNTETPEIYGFSNDLFNFKNFKKEQNTDIYVIDFDDLILKFRKGRLKVKKHTHNFNGISCFTKRTTEELPKELLTLYPAVEVIKKRYTHKITSHSKIEFSIIKFQNKTWKTICLESNKIEIVLSLSFLINQIQAEKLTYTDFLKKTSTLDKRE